MNNSKVITIDKFEGAKEIANITKNKDKPNELKVEYVDGIEIKKEKTTYAKVVNGEIVNICESSNFKANQERYYKSTQSVIKAGDKASDTNYAKHALALQDLNEDKKVQIFELPGSKKENLEKFKELEGEKYPKENFQMNQEKIPEEILEQKKIDMEEYENSKKNDTAKDSNNAEGEDENK